MYREVGTHGERVVKKHEEDLNVTLVLVRGMTTFGYCHPLVHFIHPSLTITRQVLIQYPTSVSVCISARDERGAPLVIYPRPSLIISATSTIPIDQSLEGKPKMAARPLNDASRKAQIIVSVASQIHDGQLQRCPTSKLHPPPSETEVGFQLKLSFKLDGNSHPRCPPAALYRTGPRCYVPSLQGWLYLGSIPSARMET